jgi:hypothetical protein
MSSARSRVWRQPLYHGTCEDYDRLALNGNGILWLTANPIAAYAYARFHGQKPSCTIWKIMLRPSSNVVDILDLERSSVRAFQKHIATRERAALWEWEKHATYENLDLYEGAPFFRARRVDAVICDDSAEGYRHWSVALFRLSAIESVERSPLRLWSGSLHGMPLSRAMAGSWQSVSVRRGR